MTLDEFKPDFTDRNGNLLTEILLTVDGGPDERPLNRMPQFVMTLLKKLLDVDKVKAISYAEGSSKRHCVERYHVDEGRALSQKGTIASRAVHETEINEVGLFDDDKFKDNMETSRSDCIQRIDGSPYAGSEMRALKPPPEHEWVITPETVKQI